MQGNELLTFFTQKLATTKHLLKQLLHLHLMSVMVYGYCLQGHTQLLAPTYTIDILTDDFEDPAWSYDYNDLRSDNGKWQLSAFRGRLRTVETTPTPTGGLTGSTQSLRLQSFFMAGDNSTQSDLTYQAYFTTELGRNVLVKETPMILFRAYFPSLNLAGNAIAFRTDARRAPGDRDNINNGAYYPSILINFQANIIVRLGDGTSSEHFDRTVGSLTTTGWHTFAISFDDQGIGYYYHRAGVGEIQSSDLLFTTEDFANNGSVPSRMNEVYNHFISVAYSADGSLSYNHILDDVEVRADMLMATASTDDCITGTGAVNFNISNQTGPYIIDGFPNSPITVGAIGVVGATEEVSTGVTTAGTYNYTITSSDGCEVTGSILIEDNCILPVELIDFSAKATQNGSIILEWSTATETNNSHFEIQHSTDAKSFTTLAKVKGAGTTLEKQYYQFVHEEAKVGINYYRLKQIDLPDSQAGLDGTQEYSTIISIQRNHQKDNVPMIYPIPITRDQLLNVRYPNHPANASLRILNMRGQVVLTIQPQTLNDLQIDISSLNDGIYHLMSSEGWHRRFIVSQ